MESGHEFERTYTGWPGDLVDGLQVFQFRQVTRCRETHATGRATLPAGSDQLRLPENLNHTSATPASSRVGPHLPQED